MIQQASADRGVASHEVIDELYQEGRDAVNAEINQVDDLFLMEAAKRGKSAD